MNMNEHVRRWRSAAGGLSVAAALWVAGAGCRNDELPPLTASAEQPQSTDAAASGDGRGQIADKALDARLQKLETLCESLAEKLDQMATKQKALDESLKQLNKQGASVLSEATAAKSLLMGNVDVERLKYDRNIELGAELMRRGEYEAAVNYFSKAIDIHPNGYVAFVNRGAALQYLSRWREALVDFNIARELDPENHVPWNNAAWLLATCPDDEVRNGKEAFSLAATAGELTDWEDAGVLSTLAAAHAERGEFDAALNRIKEAIEIAPEESHPELLKQQALFEARKPMRMEKPMAVTTDGQPESDAP